MALTDSIQYRNVLTHLCCKRLMLRVPGLRQLYVRLPLAYDPQLVFGRPQRLQLALRLATPERLSTLKSLF